MSAVLLTGDLAFSSKLVAAAARRGWKLDLAMSPAALDAHRTEGVRLVLIDLSMSAVDPATIVEKLQGWSPPPDIVAFGPHVQEARLAAAREAGCDLVVSRGHMNAQAEEILSRYLNIS